MQETEFRSPQLRYDTIAMLSKPMMLGMLINVLMPALLVVYCYWRQSTDPPTLSEPNLVMLAMLGMVSISEIGISLFFKYRLLKVPMVTDAAQAEAQMGQVLIRHSVICHSLLASIAVYGAIGFTLWGDFRLMIGAAVVSFLAYQFIRFRIGFVEKFVEAQENFLKTGKAARTPGI